MLSAMLYTYFVLLSSSIYAIVYRGCYRVKEYPARTIHIHDLTVYKCLSYCSLPVFYEYSGLQFGSYCTCTHSLSGTQTSDLECNYTCAGNSSTKCGGNMRRSYFNTENVFTTTKTNVETTTVEPASESQGTTEDPVSSSKTDVIISNPHGITEQTMSNSQTTTEQTVLDSKATTEKPVSDSQSTTKQTMSNSQATTEQTLSDTQTGQTASKSQYISDTLLTTEEMRSTSISATTDGIQCACVYTNHTTKPSLSKIEKKSTVLFRRSKMSVLDDRPVSVAIGYCLGYGILGIALAIVIIPDVTTLIQHLKNGT